MLHLAPLHLSVKTDDFKRLIRNLKAKNKKTKENKRKNNNERIAKFRSTDVR